MDDIVEGVVRVLDKPATPNPVFDTANPDPSTSHAPYRVYNIGNHQPVELMTFIETIENALGIKAIKNMLPMQAGDVVATFAETSELREESGFSSSPPPSTWGGKVCKLVYGLLSASSDLNLSFNPDSSLEQS